MSGGLVVLVPATVEVVVGAVVVVGADVVVGASEVVGAAVVVLEASLWASLPTRCCAHKQLAGVTPADSLSASLIVNIDWHLAHRPTGSPEGGSTLVGGVRFSGLVVEVAVATAPAAFSPGKLP